MFIQEVRRQENGHYKPPLAVLAVLTADQGRWGQLAQKPLRPPHSLTFRREELPKNSDTQRAIFLLKNFPLVICWPSRRP